MESPNKTVTDYAKSVNKAHEGLSMNFPPNRPLYKSESERIKMAGVELAKAIEEDIPEEDQGIPLYYLYHCLSHCYESIPLVEERGRGR